MDRTNEEDTGESKTYSEFVKKALSMCISSRINFLKSFELAFRIEIWDQKSVVRNQQVDEIFLKLNH